MKLLIELNKNMRHPGIEPGSPAWKAGIITLLSQCLIYTDSRLMALFWDKFIGLLIFIYYRF
jgi:hypothetical protein